MEKPNQEELERLEYEDRLKRLFDVEFSRVLTRRMDLWEAEVEFVIHLLYLGCDIAFIAKAVSFIEEEVLKIKDELEAKTDLGKNIQAKTAQEEKRNQQDIYRIEYAERLKWFRDIEPGLESTKKKAYSEAKVKAVNRMLARGLDPAFIAKAAGLSEEEVLKLTDGLKLIADADKNVMNGVTGMKKPSQEELDRIKYEGRLKCLRDIASGLEYARRNSYKEAYKEGQEEVQTEVAKKLLMGGRDIAFIVEITGLDKEKVQRLKDELELNQKS